MTSTQSDLFIRARQVIRRMPELSDQQVLAACGEPERVLAWGDGPGTPLGTVKQARRDVGAGDLA
jgi:hypothetical protein